MAMELQTEALSGKTSRVKNTMLHSATYNKVMALPGNLSLLASFSCYPVVQF